MMDDFTPAVNPVALTGSTDWHLAELSSTGYRGLELTPACIPTVDVWQPEATRLAMRPVCVNALPELMPYLTGSLSDAVEWRRRDTVERLCAVHRWMDRREIPFMVVGPSRLAENYQSKEEARLLLVSSLRDLASAGKAEILLESMPFRLFGSSKDILGIVCEADRPNVGAALDVGHVLIQGESPAEAAKVLGDRLRYVQVRDVDLRPGFPRLDAHLPLGQGSAHFEDVRLAVGDLPWSLVVTAPGDPLGAAQSALGWLEGT
jgi:sugar phosphate isomerase/epimerase